MYINIVSDLRHVGGFLLVICYIVCLKSCFKIVKICLLRRYKMGVNIAIFRARVGAHYLCTASYNFGWFYGVLRHFQHYFSYIYIVANLAARRCTASTLFMFFYLLGLHMLDVYSMVGVKIASMARY
jgi:hypothetical protein